MNPNGLAPLWYISKVGLSPIEPLVGSYIPERFRRSAVFQPHSELDCLTPEILRQIGLVQYSADTFEQAAIERLGHSIVLRCISSGEATLSPLFSKISSELIACELAAAIRTKAFDLHAVLRLRPSAKGLVCLEGFVLGSKNV